MLIKICGITKLSEIEDLNELKPDYIGFVFAKSKRQIEQDLARKGVSQDTIRNTLSGCGVDEEHNIHVLMQKKKREPGCSTQEELHKFAAFLFRKGYDYDLIRKVVFR